MDAREKMLRQFETATEEVADLARRLAEATERRDTFRKQLRAMLRNGSMPPESPKDRATNVESPESLTDTVAAIRGVGEPVDASRLAELLKVSPSIARTRLQRGTKAGMLRRLSRGKYEAMPTE